MTTCLIGTIDSPLSEKLRCLGKTEIFAQIVHDALQLIGALLDLLDAFLGLGFVVGTLENLAVAPDQKDLTIEVMHQRAEGVFLIIRQIHGVTMGVIALCATQTASTPMLSSRLLM